MKRDVHAARQSVVQGVGHLESRSSAAHVFERREREYIATALGVTRATVYRVVASEDER